MPFSYSKINRTVGFTLVEVLLTVGIITILTAAVLPSVGSFSDANILAQGAQNVASDIENAKFKALSGVYDGSGAVPNKNWGFICASSTSYQLSSFNTANTTSGAINVRTVSLPSGMVLDTSLCPAGTSIIFQRLSGIPVTAVTRTIRLTKGGRTLDVVVDSNGIISVKKYP